MECLWCFSSSSKSQMLVPASTLGLPFTAPVLDEQLVDKRRLAGAAVSADGDVPNVRDVLNHDSIPVPQKKS